ncbi:MAG: polyprenyl synthetase family protein [Desertimonas sp.]
MTLPPPSLAAIVARTDARLDEVLATEHARWVAVDDQLGAPIDEIRRMVHSGGKRLRPAFCTWGYVGLGGEPDDKRVVDAGAAIELMHAFALFHDDVMDDAASRRGAPTTHAVFAQRHGDESWAGEPRRFGEGVAILVGDLAFVLADQLLAAAPAAVWQLWNTLRLELNAGQLLDILGSVRRERGIEQAERIARYKSGKYTIERPLHLGAVLAQPDIGPARLAELSTYGLPLGDAFQMRDDVIGAFGDTALTGKPVGDDLREGKPTPLLARAVARASASQRAVLDTVGRPDLDAAAVAAVQQVITDTGALAELEQRIESLAAEAVAAIETVELADPATAELVSLAEYVVARTT